MELLIATRKGFAVAARDENAWRVTRRALDDQHLTAVIAREGTILAGGTDGLWRSSDRGRTWQIVNDGLAQPHIRWLAFDPARSNVEFAGTEPAAIFVSNDGADTWSERPAPSALRDKHGWWLPYSPADGCVRGFAFHGARAYAAVEVGGLLRSDDGGHSWGLAPGSDGRPEFGRPAPGALHPDVHSIEVHPSAADQLLAPTGGGLYRSADGGATWRSVLDGYIRAAWWDPTAIDRFVAGYAANSSGRKGNLKLTEDGGQSWRDVDAGLGMPWADNMIERFAPLGDHLFAVTAQGGLLQADAPASRWRRVLTDVTGVEAITTFVDEL